MTAPTTAPRAGVPSDAELWARWSKLERSLDDLHPCFHREYRYSGQNDCAWCQTHDAMATIERDMDTNARERMRLANDGGAA